MRGTSRASLQAVEHRFAPVLRAAGEQARTIGDELFALTDALDSSGSLRRTLADPSLDGAPKGGLVARLLDGADARTVEIAQALVRSRWSADADLADATERLAFLALLASAEADGTLAQVEQDLFSLTRALAGQREVRRYLLSDAYPAEARGDLVDRLLDGQGTAVTRAVARRAAVAPRGRRYVTTLLHVGDAIAELRSREVATVLSASPLTASQTDRLADLLGRALGRAVQVNVVVDPDVVGGLRVQAGPDVIDSTVLSRLADARRQLAG
ncbi:F0F1 ATP synthase subunit delta [Cellulomonas wangsupingiae]|uniref:ATP synthase subunit delta n=1 Tax=Cellulomonas wangsupingiae TaxID=2968085 RepID=A0ABY5KAL3_9CELL|nr:F0F1 ATP synthase subunit delta [Cellulomonas wangsupingiae]MCC2334515.1 F0F1 ATP synthase subunit delta [Cellulomonas wangsupingiae]MCM0640114.1 F0F1 ATP synthase subunit delta [Cellulomonas wangsupingiae]UUI66172.1 F0F1 ATP synthase subunit delta [Cellulomonas wangsupingiae]